MNKIPNLETENYQLKGITHDIAPSLFCFMKDANTMKYITPHPVQTLKEMEKEIEVQLSNFQKLKEIPWVIIQKSTSEVIGMFHFHKLNMWHKKSRNGCGYSQRSPAKGCYV